MNSSVANILHDFLLQIPSSGFMLILLKYKANTKRTNHFTSNPRFTLIFASPKTFREYLFFDVVIKVPKSRIELSELQVLG